MVRVHYGVRLKIMQVQESAPGKLFLVGEYAVVEAGYPAVIAAVNRYVTVKIQEDSVGRLYSEQQPDKKLTWCRHQGNIQVSPANLYPLVLSAMQVAEDYVVELGGAVQEAYAISIASELDDVSSGQKYGLGSSAAVTVAVLKAVLSFHQYAFSPLSLYKLSVLAQLRIGKTGSFGDIAASSFGGVVAYSSPDREWLCQQMKHQTLLELVQETWKNLRIEPLQLPSSIDLVVGWTGEAVSTDQLVYQMQTEKSQAEKEQIHQDFLEKSRACVTAFITACQTSHPNQLKQAVVTNRAALHTFAEGMGISIETPPLYRLCQVALSCGAVAKSSGAGGGDCGICFCETDQQKTHIYQKWQECGILPLNLQIAKKE